MRSWEYAYKVIPGLNGLDDDFSLLLDVGRGGDEDAEDAAVVGHGGPSFSKDAQLSEFRGAMPTAREDIQSVWSVSPVRADREAIFNSLIAEKADSSVNTATLPR